MRLDVKWKNREKRDDKEHHEKVRFFIYLSFRLVFFVLFLIKRLAHFLICYFLMQENAIPEKCDPGSICVTWNPGPCTWNLSPGTWNPGPIGRTRDLGPLRGTRTWHPLPGA